MTNATKTLSIAFVVLAAVSVLMELFGSRDASRAFTTEIVTADTSRVTAVEIHLPQLSDSVRLFREQGDWKVSRGSGEETYPADARAVRNALGKLTDLQVNALVTRNSEDFTRYKVDSTGTRVILKQGDQVIDKLYIGAPQVVSRRQFNNYVRPADQQEVYSVEGYLRPTFDKNISDWRDKRVWDIPGGQISRVDFLFPADSSYSIERVGENSYVSGGDSLKATEVRSILNQLGGLQAGGFVDQFNKENFGKEQFAIQMQLESGEQRTLRFREDSQNPNRYQVVADNYPYVFTVSKSTWQERVFKDREALLR